MGASVALVAIGAAVVLGLRSRLLLFHFLGSVEKRRFEGLHHFAGSARLPSGIFETLFRGQRSCVGLLEKDEGVEEIKTV